MDKTTWWRQLWQWFWRWVASNTLWELFKRYILPTIIGAGFFSYGSAPVMSSLLAVVVTTKNIFFILLGLLLMGWGLGLIRFPKRTKQDYSVTRCMELIHIIGDNISPIIHVNEYSSKILDSYSIVVINALPFPITLEYVKLSAIYFELVSWISGEQLIENRGMQSGDSYKIEVPSKHLTEDQVKVARNHSSQCSKLVFNGTAYFKFPTENIQKVFSISATAVIQK